MQFVVVNTAYLKEHFELAIRQVKKSDLEELESLETKITDLITELVDSTEQE